MHRPLARGGSAERRRRCGRRRSGRRRSTGRWHGGRSATRVYRRRKGGAAAERGKLRPMARGRPAARMNRRRKGGAAAKRRGGGREGTPADGTGPADRAAEEELRLRAQGGSAERQRSSSCGHKAGRRNGGGGAGGEGGAPAAGTGPVRGAGVPAAKRRGGSRRRKTPAGGTPGSGTKKGLRCRRPVSGGPDYIIYYRFCSPRIRIATSRIVVSSNVTTPPSGPGSK